jgi:outer membrane protein assembly factor BamB
METERRRLYMANAHHIARVWTIVLTLVLGLASSAAAQPTWEVFQLTQGAVSDFAPQVSGTTYVWKRGLGSIGQILMWTEGDPQPVVISTGSQNRLPSISNGVVVWASRIGSDDEIIRWESGSTQVLTNTPDDEADANVGGSGIVWRFSNQHIVYFDGATETIITAGVSGADEYPRVVDDFVVWESNDGSDAEVFVWDNGTQWQLTNNGYIDVRPETDGTQIVWQAESGPGGTGEIWRWDGRGSAAVTNNAVYDAQPDVSGPVIVFVRDDGSDFEIFFRYLGVDYQITDNDVNDFEPAVDGDRVVWQTDAGSDRHIYYAILSGLDGGEVPGACCTGLTCASLTASACAAADGLFIGEETFCTVDTCPDAIAPAAGWSTYQHDMRRSGATEAVMPQVLTPQWFIFIGDKNPAVSPVIGTNGMIWVSGSGGLVAVQSDGSPGFIVPFSDEPLAPPSIRQDGHLFVRILGSILRKVNYQDGTELCSIQTTSEATAPAIDAAGNVYLTGGTELWKVTPDCQQDWVYHAADVVDAHVAIGPDGQIYSASDSACFKVDAATGDEIWTFPTPDQAGHPAIGPDGTIFLHYAPDKLLAINPDGSEKWTLQLTGLRNVNLAPAPAVAPDGTVYVVSETWPLPDDPTIVAVSPDGDELWRHTEPGGFDPRSPVIDGSGRILFSMGDVDTVILKPETGTVLGTLALKGAGYIDTSPAIGEDGVVYATTSAGYLVAFADGCGEIVSQEPMYTYRQVLEENQLIEDFTIEEIEALEINEAGLATVQARVSPGQMSAVFTEISEGRFSVIGQGSMVDGWEMDDVSMARSDGSGKTYMPAYVVDVGPAVFVDGVLKVAETSAAPLTLDTLDWNYVDHDESGHMLVYGHELPGSLNAVLRIDSESLDVQVLLAEGSVVDSFLIDTLQPAALDGYGDDGVLLCRAQQGAGQFAILTPDEVIARTGDVIDGITMTAPDLPRRSGPGTLYFRASGNVFSRPVGGSTQLAVAVGELVAGQSIVSVESYSVNDSDHIAYRAQLFGTTGVFVGSEPVAVTALTTIADQTVAAVVREVNLNNQGQVAFVAKLDSGLEKLFVATPNPTSQDCNDNGFSDTCDINTLTSSDCNLNIIPDECDLASGKVADLNANGTPDECDACAALSDCSDGDGDGIRDDNCVWWSCAAGHCAGSEIVFADLGGFSGACPPDGTADINDRFHALNCFSDVNTSGASGYPCEEAPPAAFNGDAGGAFGDCDPDGVCDGHDAFHALNAFQGTTTCSCLDTAGPGPAPARPSAKRELVVEGRAAILLKPRDERIRSGGAVVVDVYLENALPDLRGYQLHLGVRGGHSGDLVLADMTIQDRPDHVFAGLGYWSAFNRRTAQMVAGLDSAGVATGAQAYLASFMIRSSPDAEGTFAIELLADESDTSHRTFLFPSPARDKITIKGAAPAIITVTSGR